MAGISCLTGETYPMRITSTVLLTILALSACLTAQADEGAPPRETIAVPSSYPPNWLEKQLPMELAGGSNDTSE